ncbi:hypothetical protein [Rheinheimera sp.]|uniref:hypothetical protein n=1 Tax=Rheinheimera sp. TaxID=1869214 RepID=UPI0027B96C66|nr:hypothetical protein [Rheinheimera sp.]
MRVIVHRQPLLVFFVLIAGLCCLATTQVRAESRDNVNCGIQTGKPLDNGARGYGPYDASNPQHADKLPIVLNAHFTREVEQLVKGSRDANLMRDIDYTLRAIPNYHRALVAMSKYARLKGKAAFNGVYTPECYFKRALYFQPKDGLVYAIYATHLHLSGKLAEAEQHYQSALKLTKNKIEINYNYGLLLFDKGDYAAAKSQADIAYKSGYQLQGLKRKLKTKGIVL